MNSKSVKEAARRFGADLVGIASADRFSTLPAEQNPRSIFPQAECVIVIARRIPRGSLRTLENGGDSGNAFSNFGFYYLEDQYLSKSTYDLTIWMEANHFEAVPIFGYDAEAASKHVLASPVSEKKPAPNVYVNVHFAAQAAGLGEVGKNGLFLTPEFGPLQRFALLLTDAKLECDSEISPGFCRDCKACADGCPAGALGPETGADGQFQCRKNRCAVCRTGAIQTDFGRFNTIDRIGAACGRACLDSLEKRGRIQKRFHQPFRAAGSNS